MFRRAAAVVIQRVFRRHLVLLRARHRRATVIQSVWRGYRLRLGLHQQHEAARVLQKYWRRHLAQQHKQVGLVILQKIFRWIFSYFTKFPGGSFHTLEIFLIVYFQQYKSCLTLGLMPYLFKIYLYPQKYPIQSETFIFFFFWKNHFLED